MPVKRPTWESARMNNRTYLDYYYRLTELAINMFEWKYLPPTVDERFLELTLYSTGMAVFFEDEVMGYLALSTMIGGNLDVYRVPRIRTAYAVNGYNRRLDETDSVLIFNNYLRQPSMLAIELYAQRLYELERTIDVNVKAQKTPVLIQGTEQQRLTLKNLYMQYDGNAPFIFGNKSLDVSGIQAINTQAPYVADKLEILKHQIWNEALTYLGIENANQDKRERMITDEVSSNLGAVEAQRYTKLNARRQAADAINRMFGLNIQVDFRSSFMTVSRETNTEETKEVVENNE